MLNLDVTNFANVSQLTPYILNVMQPLPPRRVSECKKAVMTVGPLHLQTTVDMSSLGIGEQIFESIGSFLASDFKQSFVSIYDCIDKVNAGPARNACETNTGA